MVSFLPLRLIKPVRSFALMEALSSFSFCAAGDSPRIEPMIPRRELFASSDVLVASRGDCRSSRTCFFLERRGDELDFGEVYMGVMDEGDMERGGEGRGYILSVPSPQPCLLHRRCRLL